MRKILSIITLETGVVTDSATELNAASRALASGEGKMSAILMGSALDASAATLAGMFDEVIVVDDPRLADPDGDLFAAAAAPIIRREAPDVVLMAHTNFAMDVVPRLSIRLQRPLMTDCLELKISDDSLSAVRSMYAGKVHCRTEASLSPAGCIATIRPGAFDSAPANAAAGGGTLRRESLAADVASRRRFIRTVHAGSGDVDLSQAEVLVAVGRGIEDGENMEIVEALAEALGAEIACSRPVVDNGWLPKTRQVGTSGVTVRPKIYLTVGISGSFQHMGGVKGNPFIAAINSDPRAPIFNEADVGIVGNLFDIVPLLTEKIMAAKS